MELNEIEKLGIPDVKEWAAVPKEWVCKGKKPIPKNPAKVKAGEDPNFYVLVFERPNEPDLELWSHSMRVVHGQLEARIDHVERQAELARKGKGGR